MTQQTYLLNLISENIKDLFSFHEYEISKENLKRLTILILEKKPKIKEDQIKLFFDKVLKGEFGILYRQPTCITSMYNKFINEEVSAIPSMKYREYTK